MSNQLNIRQVIAVAEKLQHVRDDVVFVGGSTTVFLVDDIASGVARQTEDVDFVVDITLRGHYHKFEEKMRALGFVNDTSEGAPICRWVMDFMGAPLKIDAMPVDEAILGFSNRWYRSAVDTAWQKEIKPGLVVNIVDPVYFLGTKYEAFLGRGNNDIFSHDLEDIFYVLEHRSGIEEIVFSADKSIKQYLSRVFAELLNHPDLENTLPGMLDNSSSVNIVLDKMIFIAEKCTLE